METMTDRLLTPREAAGLLGLKEQTLAVWRLRGNGPTYRKLNGACRYRASDLETFIEAGARRSTSEVGKVR